MTIDRPPHSSIALPRRSLTKAPLPGDDYEFKWIDSASTSVAATFARIRAEQAAKSPKPAEQPKTARVLRSVKR